MNTFKKKSLYLAVAGVSALGAGSASAVSLNADGLGQVLIYPYYTVRETSPGSAYNSLLSVVNSTGSAKAVKVRFLEGKNSREVLDFNLYLSAKDVWVAAVIPTADGAGIVTPDNSCTDGQVSQDESNPTPFVNYAYTGDFDDPANDDLDRTREGYVEIIEMGTMWGYGARMVTPPSTTTCPGFESSQLPPPSAPTDLVAAFEPFGVRLSGDGTNRRATRTARRRRSRST